MGKDLFKNIIRLKSIDSTNEYAAELVRNSKLPNGTVILANYQKNGKGHSGSVWQSKAGKNLLLSIIYYPQNLRIEEQFYLSKSVSLAISNFLINAGLPSVSIKWPNDIYIEDKKVAGLLIENTLLKDQILYSIIGMGINLNQTNFPKEIPNPVSIKHYLKLDLDIEFILAQILEYIAKSIRKLENRDFEKMDRDYLDTLYRYEEWTEFLTGNKKLNGKIINVSPEGKLVIEFPGVGVKSYGFKEIEYVL